VTEFNKEKSALEKEHRLEIDSVWNQHNRQLQAKQETVAQD